MSNAERERPSQRVEVPPVFEVDLAGAKVVGACDLEDKYPYSCWDGGAHLILELRTGQQLRVSCPFLMAALKPEAGKIVVTVG